MDTSTAGFDITADAFTCGWCKKTQHFVAVDAGPYMLAGGYGLALLDEAVLVGVEAEHRLSGEIVRLRHDCPKVPHDLAAEFRESVTTGSAA